MEENEDYYATDEEAQEIEALNTRSLIFEDSELLELVQGLGSRTILEVGGKMDSEFIPGRRCVACIRSINR